MPPKPSITAQEFGEALWQKFVNDVEPKLLTKIVNAATELFDSTCLNHEKYLSKAGEHMRKAAVHLEASSKALNHAIDLKDDGH